MSNLRPTQSGTFSIVRRSLASNARKLVGFQQQVATGRRILKQSDDVIGSSRALSFRRQIASADRFLSTIGSSRPTVDAATSALEQGGTLITEARTLLLQGMNGTLTQSDRTSLGDQLDLLLDSLLDIANTKSGEDYVFSGTETGRRAFQRGANGKVAYQGNQDTRKVSIGSETEISVGIPGSEAFGRFEFEGLAFSSLTGAQAGSSANQGVGDAELTVRHDATAGALGSGLAFANGGSDDTLIGSQALVIDATAGTVQLGNGEAVDIPNPLTANFVVEDENGAEVHLDFSGFTGAGVSTTLTGTGSVSLDGVNFTAFTGSETDLQLVNAADNAVVHVNLTNVNRAGSELIQFKGTVDVFAAIEGIVSDLRNEAGLEPNELIDRLGLRLDELDRNHNNLLGALGTLGGSAQRMDLTQTQTEELDLRLRGLLSDVEDADFSELILDLTQTEQTLELAQLSGTRLIQTSLLNYLR